MLKKIMNFYHGENDIEKEPPRAGIKRVGYILLNYPGKLFILNLVFLISALPVITLPTAVIAMNNYLEKIVRIGYNFSLEDYFKEYKSSIIKKIILGLVPTLFLFYGYYLMSLAGNYGDTALKSILFGIGLPIFLLAALFGQYVFVIASMVDVRIAVIFKNAAILMILEWKAGIKTLFLEGCLIALLVAFLPYSLYLAFIGFFSVFQLVSVSFLSPTVIKRIVNPYENKQEEESDGDH